MSSKEPGRTGIVISVSHFLVYCNVHIRCLTRESVFNKVPFEGWS